ncbi:MAG: phage antirepressor KilAC domain-containing protein [Cetobacterium sp.]|uniref:phage antirepressor KilAC domain-containing protein n=1 Tax=Cetobacterium sp. TaxID=2071632 RepID=UPI002FCC9C4C
MKLVQIENKNGIINSLELLEQINFFRKQEGNRAELQHRDLLKIIRDEFEEEINEGKISPVTYKDKKGEDRPMFELTTAQSKQVLVRESKFVRKAVIKKLEELEQNTGLKVPTSFREALLLAAEQQEKIEILEIENKIKEQQIAEFKPRIEYLDTILKSKDTLTITQIAADYGISAQKLNSILHNEKIQRKVGGQWLLYTDKMGKGYTKSETVTIKSKNSSKEDKVVVNTKWTQKGRIQINEILNKLGIVANMDREKIA